MAKLALFAYDRASGQLVWSSGTMLDQADTKNVFVGGFGPIKSGSIQNGTEVVGIKIPLTAKMKPRPVPTRPNRTPPSSPPTTRQGSRPRRTCQTWSRSSLDQGGRMADHDLMAGPLPSSSRAKAAPPAARW